MPTDTTTIVTAVIALAVISTAAAGDIPGCAHLSYEGECGQNGQGQNCFVVNEHKDKSIKVTVSRKYSDNGQNYESQSVYPVSAGGKKIVGCTRGYPFNGVFFRYEIVGCEIK